MKAHLILPLLALCACSKLSFLQQEEPATASPAPAIPTAPQVETVTIAPAANARTADQFDTTSAAERARAAAAPEPASERSLGTTVASLGDPSRAGFWLETPLVTEPTPGRVVYAASGKSAKVDLIPISDGGSRISLAAMQLIEAPLTDLPTLEVYAGGANS